MKKKGFTLIELLAVIIILAVIALIATPIVLNVVENAKKQANKNSVYGIMDSARLYYTESLLDSSKSSNINGSTNLIDEIKVSGKKPDSGVLYINNKGESALALVYDNVCYKKNFTEKDLTESEDTSNCTLNIEEQKVCRVTEGTGENIGDVITCGTESFYVYDTTGDNIKMLAKYNLKVGGIYNNSYTTYQESEMTYLQNKDMKGYINGQTKRYGVTEFSSDNQKGINYSSYEGSIVQEYVDAYATMLRNMGVNVTNVSLITKKEIEQLISNGNNLPGGSIKNEVNASSRSWVYSTSYWSGSVFDDNKIWGVSSVGALYGGSCISNDYYGVRPVITIPKSEIEV